MAETRKIYPYDADTVFKGLKDICYRSEFVVKKFDESIRRIIISTPLSLFSFGENIEIIVQPKENNKALVYVKSEPKVFHNITAESAVERNIVNIFQMLDEEFQCSQ